MRYYTLRLKNTGELFALDKDDWEKAKHCGWKWVGPGKIENDQGISIEEYCGIKGVRRPVSSLRSFKRNNYES